MNILQMEDMVKGLPDDRLQQEAQNPSGQMPQFLLVSEVQRRTKMRKDFATQSQEQPQGTIVEQTLAEAQQQPPPQQQPQLAQAQQGLGAIPQQPMSPQPPAQPMASGGLVRRMYGGGNTGNIYQRAADERAAAHERGEVLTLKQIAKNMDEGGIGAWNSSLPEDQQVDIGGGIRSLWDGAKDIWDEIHWTPPEGAVPPKREKTPQEIKAEGAVVPNDKSIGTGDEGGDTGDPDTDGIAGLVSAAQASKANEEYPYPGGKSPYELLSQAKLERSDLVDQARNSGLDVTDLTARARKDAWGAALMQLGAGIAGGDLAQGLQGSARAMDSGMQEARRLDLMGAESGRRAEADARQLEMQGRTTEYEQQKELSSLVGKERDSALNRALTKYGLDIRQKSQLSWIQKNANDELRYKMETVEGIIERIEDELSPLKAHGMTDEEKIAKVKERDDAIKYLMVLSGLSKGEDDPETTARATISPTPWNDLGD